MEPFMPTRATVRMLPMMPIFRWVGMTSLSPQLRAKHSFDEGGRAREAEPLLGGLSGPEHLLGSVSGYQQYSRIVRSFRKSSPQGKGDVLVSRWKGFSY